MSKPLCWLFLLLITAPTVYSQDADTLAAQVNSLMSPVKEDTTVYSSADSLSIFGLIDSILTMDIGARSQLALRLSYNSNVLSAGRTLGIENFGLAPGITYYHKSGVYADLSGYWSKDFIPSYYLTVASLGYIKDFTKHFSLMAGYDHYFYNASLEYIPYRSALSITPIAEVKPVSLSLNYSYYFGDQTAHRIMPGLMVTLEKKKLWKIDRAAISASYFMLLGNEVITTIEFIRVGRRLQAIEKSTNVFGIMNHALSIPLNLSMNDWGFCFTYTYNVPKALPGEILTFSKSTYLSASLSYFIEFRGR